MVLYTHWPQVWLEAHLYKSKQVFILSVQCQQYRNYNSFPEQYPSMNSMQGRFWNKCHCHAEDPSKLLFQCQKEVSWRKSMNSFLVNPTSKKNIRLVFEKFYSQYIVHIAKSIWLYRLYLFIPIYFPIYLVHSYDGLYSVN